MKADEQSRTLYVLFHGSMVFVERHNDMIDVLLTDMGGEHAYRAGSWLAEACFRTRRPLTLCGVNKGEAYLGNTCDLPGFQHGQPSSQSPRHVLQLPRPKPLLSQKFVAP